MLSLQVFAIPSSILCMFSGSELRSLSLWGKCLTNWDISPISVWLLLKGQWELLGLSIFLFSLVGRMFRVKFLISVSFLYFLLILLVWQSRSNLTMESTDRILAFHTVLTIIISRLAFYHCDNKNLDLNLKQPGIFGLSAPVVSVCGCLVLLFPDCAHTLCHSGDTLHRRPAHLRTAGKQETRKNWRAWREEGGCAAFHNWNVSQRLIIFWKPDPYLVALLRDGGGVEEP